MPVASTAAPEWGFVLTTSKEQCETVSTVGHKSHLQPEHSTRKMGVEAVI